MYQNAAFWVWNWETFPLVGGRSRPLPNLPPFWHLKTHSYSPGIDIFTQHCPFFRWHTCLLVLTPRRLAIWYGTRLWANSMFCWSGSQLQSLKQRVAASTIWLLASAKYILPCSDVTSLIDSWDFSMAWCSNVAMFSRVCRSRLPIDRENQNKSDSLHSCYKLIWL